MYNQKSYNIFKSNLRRNGISMSLDQERRSDGKRLENYVFEKDGKVCKIIEPIIHRDFGQSHIFVATGSTKQGEEYKYVPLTDKEYYNQWLLMIKGILK